MRVYCEHCESKALITSSNKISTTLTELYCQCTNTKDCGAGFVVSLAFKHYINPPQQTTLQMAAALLQQLPINERNALMQRDLFG